ncbi:MAG TPA: hypothetical protein VF789_14595 [Thermoanaerobaculia bacterium]
MDLESYKKDPAGFPMLQVEPDLYLHWLPVTKIQFEYFLSDAYDRSFDSRWYEELLGLNPRVTPAKISPENYWNAFLSGVLPAEAQRFAFWCGDEYRLPSAEEWARVYRILNSQPTLDLEGSGLVDDLPPRLRELILRTEDAAAEAARRLGYVRRLADQFLMRLGVLEWVGDDESWGAMGEPFPELCGNLAAPETGEPLYPNRPDTVRLPCLGFRLVYVNGKF